MTSNMESLRVLNVSGCKVLTDDIVRPVLAANRLLHTVDLSECHHLTSAMLQALALNCKRLER